MLVPGTIHVIDASKQYCARCGVSLPPEASRSDCGPGFGVARDVANADSTKFFTPEQLVAPLGPYVLCGVSENT